MIGADKRILAEALAGTRAKTLALLSRVPDAFLKTRVHDFYSPVGWHFGHIGMTEEFWACGQALGLSPLDEKLSFLFANLPENSKDNRVHLPSRDEIIVYLSITRDRTLAALESAGIASPNPLLNKGYAWEFARQHECQHQETIAEMLQLIYKAIGSERDEGRLADYEWATAVVPPITETVSLPGGTFMMGSNDCYGYDNEKCAHSVTVDPFALDRTTVTARQWRDFMSDGGYKRPELWTKDGWAWRESERAERPEYWQPTRSGESFLYYGIKGLRLIHPEEPVSAVSWYEADAYARWVRKRLPTEAEWEYAALYNPEGKPRRFPWGDSWDAPPRPAALADFDLTNEGPLSTGSRPFGASALGLQDMAGSVWEWTASPFLPYPGFEAFPYDGYSKEHMDGRHFVCRGGSWATSETIARSTFRNWYVPGYRQGFLGLRCAISL